MSDRDSTQADPAAEDGSLEGPDVETPSANDSEGTSKADGLGDDGTIPDHPAGVGVGWTGEPSTFEPEEDEAAPTD